MDKARFAHGWNRTVRYLAFGFAIFWTASVGLYALASMVDAIGSFHWGLGQNLWLALGMTALGLLFIWLLRIVSKVLTAITTSVYGPDAADSD